MLLFIDRPFLREFLTVKYKNEMQFKMNFTGQQNIFNFTNKPVKFDISATRMFFRTLTALMNE